MKENNCWMFYQRNDIFQLSIWSKQIVLTKIFVTAYGSQFEAGRLSSRYPHCSSSTWRGIRILTFLDAVADENDLYEAVSCFPVRRRVLSKPPVGS